jgi:L-threonylcarbamoyladenylate synthase
LGVDPDDLYAAAEVLRKGGLVGMPTETVYGLAAHAFDPQAILGVFAAKGRPHFDPLIAHVLGTTLAEIEHVVDLGRMGTRATCVAEALLVYWPGPLTLVLPKHADVPDEATSGLDTVAVRSPSHPVARALLETFGAPLVAPSANRFGHISPTTADAVREELGDALLVLNGGPCTHGVESTIVGVESDGTARLLRPGALAREDIERTLGTALRAPSAKVTAPGMLASHYAPRKTLRLASNTKRWPAGPAAWLSYTGAAPPAGIEVAHVEVLTPDGTAATAARRLFATLRRLDALTDIEWILAEECPDDTGLGPAIRDRLQRASAER